MRAAILSTLLAAVATVAAPAQSVKPHDPAKLERSVWINVSLAAPKLGYWGNSFPAATKPSDAEISNAARMLGNSASPNRLYLIYHREIPIADAQEIFRSWRKACPAEVELVPTLLLRMYDSTAAEVFPAEDLATLTKFLKAEINPHRIAVYDVLPKRDQGPGLLALSREFPNGLLRVGLQPGEPLAAPFTGAVEDTWSGFCHGLTNDDWRDRGFGRDTLRRWVAERNAEPAAIAYDLIVVAWDYSNTKRGEYPGYDDAHKNLPLPANRNFLGANDILAQAQPDRLAGFSSDLLILELNSETPQHDGPHKSFYETLKTGQPYDGFYAAPWREVCQILHALSSGRFPP